MTKCSNCGAEYANAVPKFCSACGKPMTQQPASPPQQPQTPNPQQSPQAVMTPPHQNQAQNGFPMPPQNNAPNPNCPPQNSTAQNIPQQNRFAGQMGPMGNQPGMGADNLQNQNNFYSNQGNQPGVQQNNAYKPMPESLNEDDQRAAVLGTGGFFLTTFLCSLPIIGFIMTIIWGIGVGKTNLNRRNYCRSMIIMWLISIILTAITTAIVGVAITPMLEELLAVLQESGMVY